MCTYINDVLKALKRVPGNITIAHTFSVLIRGFKCSFWMIVSFKVHDELFWKKPLTQKWPPCLMVKHESIILINNATISGLPWSSANTSLQRATLTLHLLQVSEKFTDTARGWSSLTMVLSTQWQVTSPVRVLCSKYHEIPVKSTARGLRNGFRRQSCRS